MQIPEVKPREELKSLWGDAVPGQGTGYFESDRDWAESNMDAVIWFLENRDELAKIVQQNRKFM